MAPAVLSLFDQLNVTYELEYCNQDFISYSFIIFWFFTLHYTHIDMLNNLLLRDYVSYETQLLSTLTSPPSNPFVLGTNESVLQERVLIGTSRLLTQTQCS